MKLCLKGHDFKYAAEQIFLIFFPAEKPVYIGEPEGDCALLALLPDRAEAEIALGGRVFRAESPLPPLPEDETARRSLFQKHLKLAFYLAAREATGVNAPWGAITGIRPVKLATALLKRGASPEEARAALQSEFFTAAEQAALALECAEATRAAELSLSPEDISLYVGIPFCPSRCAYCSFVSNSVEKSMQLVEPYLAALYREIEAAGRLVRETGRRIVSLYIGGGTPTTLSAEQLAELFRRLDSAFGLGSLREFTVEAGRPDTIDRAKLRAIRDAGAERISINPQSMDDAVLAASGRRHSSAQTEAAFALAREEGFRLINSDLIAGLPADTPEKFAAGLSRLLALEPENVTVHTLALKKGSKLTEGGFLPSEAAVTEMLAFSRARLREAGYAPYYLYRQKFTAGNFENLGWARPGAASLYNICIMEELHTILALGGGGVTKMVAPDCGRIERIFNAKYPYEYIGKIDKEIEDKEKLKSFIREYK